jgi:hypothetical protein
MKLNLTILMAIGGVLLGAGAGVGARLFLGQTPTPEEVAGASDHAAAQKDAHADEPKKKGGKSKGHGEEKKEEKHYFKFSRQFVVPVLVNGSPGATMVLDVLIEMKPGFEDLYSDEPTLRDAVLRALLRKTSEGALGRIFAEPELMEALRAEILAEVDQATDGAAQSILVLDIGYQAY